MKALNERTRFLVGVAAVRMLVVTLLTGAAWVIMVFMSETQVSVPEGFVTYLSKPALFGSAPPEIVEGPAIVRATHKKSYPIFKVNQPGSLEVEFRTTQKRLVVFKDHYVGKLRLTVQIPKRAIEETNWKEQLEQRLTHALVRADPPLHKIEKKKLKETVEEILHQALGDFSIEYADPQLSPIVTSSSNKPDGVTLDFKDRLFSTIGPIGVGIESFFPTGFVFIGLIVGSWLGAVGLIPAFWVVIAPFMLVSASTTIKREVENGQIARDCCSAIPDCSICDPCMACSHHGGSCHGAECACTDCPNCHGCDAGGCDCGGCDCSC